MSGSIKGGEFLDLLRILLASQDGWIWLACYILNIKNRILCASELPAVRKEQTYFGQS
jgi:hypothetical protein